MFFSAPRDLTLPDERKNFSHFVLDITWFGLASAATSRFMSVYAIRLGADEFTLGLLAALPALMLMLSSSLGMWWLNRHANSSRALFWPAIGFRLIFLLPALAPFLPENIRPYYLVFAILLPAIPQGLAAVAFVVMMRESIFDNHMTALLSRRMLSMNIAVGLAALAFGLWLEKAPFPINYQAMFVVAFGFAMVSAVHCNKVRVLHPAEKKQSVQAKVNPWKNTRFLTVAFVVMATHIAFTSILPLTSLRLVDELRASEGFMALFGVCELVAGASIALFTNRIVTKIGNRRMIAMAMLGTAMAGFILATIHNLPLTLLAAVISGASWTAVGIGLFGFFNESTPPEQMGAFSVAYHQAIGLAMFIGPMVGSFVASISPNLVMVLMFGAGLRLAAAVMIDHKLVAKAKELPYELAHEFAVRTHR